MSFTHKNTPPFCIWLIISIGFLCISFNSNAQSQINIGTSYMVINGGTVSAPLYLTIDNGNANALTHSSTGHIITASQYDKIKWNIGTNTGNYIFATGVGATYIPFEYNISSAGTGSGSLTLATWYTLNNAIVPDGGYYICPNENNAINRFWTINLDGYDSSPTATTRFYYNPTELDGIPEALLQAQNGDLEFSCPWGQTKGTVNTSLGYIEVLGITGSSPWKLSDLTDPLPIELLFFKAEWKNSQKNEVLLEWATASETNNDYFEIQRSIDAVHFNTILTVEGSGNSNQIINYSTEDVNPFTEHTSYYRLKQVDFDGNFKYSPIEDIYPYAETNIFSASVYPNPASENISLMINSQDETDAVIFINDNLGRTLYKNSEKINKGNSIMKIDINQFTTGSYILHIVTAKSNVFQIKLIINNNL